MWLESLALIHTTDEKQGRKEIPTPFRSFYHPQLPNGLTKPSEMCDIHQQTLLYNGKKTPKKQTYSKESHATLKSKLQIQPKKKNEHL